MGMNMTAALEWATDLIRDSSLVTDPAVCERLEECDQLLGRTEGPDNG